MAKKLSNNMIVVVTGGAKGIGYAIAEEFLNEGAKTVFLIDINEKQGSEVATILNSEYGNGKAVFLKGDVTKDLDKIYSEIVNKHGHIDILVNNAGVADEFSIRRTLEINTVATVEWSMKFYENMRKDKGGRGGVILNIASIYGYLVDQHAPFYKTSKYAVMGFTKTLGHAVNYETTGVKVIVICPGVTKTDIVKNVTQNEAFDFHVEKFQDFLDSAPSQEKEDVAKAAVEIIANSRSGLAWSIISGKLEQLP